MLHLIFQLQNGGDVLERMGEGDAAVFLDSAVLALLNDGSLASRLQEILKGHRLYVLAEDMALRGIQTPELAVGLEPVDYAELVRLTVEHPKTVSWP